MSDFEITISRSPEDIRAAQKLRFEVFNLEMKKGLQASYARGLDVDDFDPICDHLIVRERKSTRVVGTYRLLLGSTARKHLGFYSEHEFNLDRIKRLDGELLELGRSCAHKDYRDRALIHLMWQSIAEYVKNHRVRYLFGCASFPTADPLEVSGSMALVKEKFYAPEKFRVEPLPELRIEGLDEKPRIDDPDALFATLPSLIKGYLRVGAKLCGPPALDREFGTTDLFLLLDILEISGEYLKRFGLSPSDVSDAHR
ncbi:MAG TPA: GNAT family N-acyltransferase [Candidatus Binatia bacterium]|jgi:putative hemolysin|nr:GNAT family N-acyltransferase [Candidatus Binatia bacterium]